MSIRAFPFALPKPAGEGGLFAYKKMSKKALKKVKLKKQLAKTDFLTLLKQNLKQKFALQRWHKILMAVFLLFFLLPTGTIFAFEEFFRERIYPGIKIGDLKLGGKTKEQAIFLLEQKIQKYNELGLTFTHQGKQISVMPIVTATDDPDLSRLIFSFDKEKTIDEAFSLGRDKEFFENIKNQINFLFSGRQIQMRYQYNADEIEQILRENFNSFEIPAENAKLNIISDDPLMIEVISEKFGQVIDYRTAIDIAFQNVAELKNGPVTLNFIHDEPKIKKTQTATAQERVKKLIKLCSITLIEDKKTWTINQDQIKNWLEFQTDSVGVTVGLNKSKVEEYLKTLAPEINTSPQDAKFKIENGKVREFQIHQNGKELDFEASYQKINDYILKLDTAAIEASCQEKSSGQTETAIELAIKTTAPQIPIGNINELGIKELVGVGTSNFSGSPPNRRHNIVVGAAKLNGILIAPSEEFSLNKALGEISGATGYLPELVIKGNKTIPEFGGGLCQIATTMFRVALDAGLPITERKAHSYRVVYYEPAGIDATIYSPSPDFKFINDTPAYLLLQTKIEGDELIFELWGTSDGRKTEISKPKIFNITNPGPTKIVETEDLPPGVKKCTERAHAGADAEFSRTITFANGETKTETWYSHYVPWPAVCLVGKEAIPPEEEVTPPSDETQIEPPPAINTNVNANTNSPTF